MTTRTRSWPPGTPCWADLTAPDVPAAAAFYTALLGWEIEESGPEYGGYVMASVGGRSVAGIGVPQNPGVPPVWTMYLASDDVDATGEAIGDAGGTVLVAPFDVGTLGRMLVATDPAGAAFGVWQAGGHHGFGVVNEPGAVTWEDLRSTDTDASQAFYTAVFGFGYEPVPGAPDDYTTFALPDGEAMGGIGGMMGAPDGVPSHWLVYFAVADLAAAVATVREYGGQVHLERMETEFGIMGAVADPNGAAFWLVQAPGQA